MKCGLQTQRRGLEQILLFATLIIVGLSPVVRSAWGQDAKLLKPHASAKTTPTVDPDDSFDVDQIYASVRFLSVPTELVESAISDWTLAPFDQKLLTAADPFNTMKQQLPQPDTKLGREMSGQVTAGTEMQIPSIHKILNDQEVELLLALLEKDERTRSVLNPQLVFIDGMTASVVVGEHTPFVVGWKNGSPQTRFVPKGKMVRLRTVLDEDKLWLDYEIIISRILDVTTRSIRVANRQHPIKLAVPNVQTTKANATVELPVGGTLLIGGLPAESHDGIPHQLLVLLRADRIQGLQARKTAKPDPQDLQRQVAVGVTKSPTSKSPVEQRLVAEEKRNPFSLISRFFDRTPK